MANPNSAGRDQSRKADRKLRSQMGAENQTMPEGEKPEVKDIGYKPLSNEAPFAAKLQSSLTKAAALYDKGELGVRYAWIAIGDALNAAKKPFINLGEKGEKGGESVDNGAYGAAVKAWVADWSKAHEKDHPVLAKNLLNANVRSAAIWLADRWEKPIVDATTGEQIEPAVKDVRACRVQNNPVHCRDAYTRWRTAMDKVEVPDLDYIAPRTSDGNGSSGSSSRSGPTGAQIAKALYEKLLRNAQAELLNERLKAKFWEGEALRFKAERDDALAQLRSQSIPVNEPAGDAEYIDIDPSEYTEVACVQGVRNLKARGEEAMPDLDATIKLLTGPTAKAAKPAKVKVEKPAKPAKAPRVIKAKKPAKAKGEEAADALQAKGRKAKAKATEASAPVEHKADDAPAAGDEI